MLINEPRFSRSFTVFARISSARLLNCPEMGSPSMRFANLPSPSKCHFSCASTSSNAQRSPGVNLLFNRSWQWYDRRCCGHRKGWLGFAGDDVCSNLGWQCALKHQEAAVTGINRAKTDRGIGAAVPELARVHVSRNADVQVGDRDIVC
jgi:hypothetical protein